MTPLLCQVSLYLPPFMAKNPNTRPGMATYEMVMGSLATVVEEAAAEEVGDQARSEGVDGLEYDYGQSDGDFGMGLDLGGDDEDYEDNELF